MAIEIGSLVVRGTFGRPETAGAQTESKIEEKLQLMRNDILEEVRDMMAEAERLARER